MGKSEFRVETYFHETGQLLLLNLLRYANIYLCYVTSVMVRWDVKIDG